MRFVGARLGALAVGVGALLTACAGSDDRSDQQATQVQPTAIAVSMAGPARYVPASDARIHLEYDLLITNAIDVPVDLQSLVVTADDRELARFDAEEFATMTHVLPASGPTGSVGPSQLVMSAVDVVFPGDDVAAVPAEVVSHITYEIAGETELRSLISSLTADAPISIVDHEDIEVVEAPLRGAGWWNASGCCDPRTAHRSIILPGNGTFHAIETFAIDWVQAEGGVLRRGDGTELADFTGFGAAIYSATQGEVVNVRNDMPETALGVSLGDNPSVQGPGDYGGNNVVVKLREDRYVLYGHMQPGSVRVRVGDQVEPGDELGLLGNTGNSTIPHLHFGLLDGPDPTTSDSVPFVIDSYTLTGRGTTSDFETLSVTGESREQRRTFPLVFDVMDFGP
jgi:Peptidase family M23